MANIRLLKIANRKYERDKFKVRLSVDMYNDISEVATAKGISMKCVLESAWNNYNSKHGYVNMNFDTLFTLVASL